MQRTRDVAWACWLGAMTLGADGVHGQGTASGARQASATSSAQAYPNKPIRMVTAEPGGNGDFNARLVSDGIAAALGQPVIVENRGGTVIAGQTVGKAQPDGYTLLVSGTNFYVGSLLQAVPYDPVKDFSPITVTTTAPSVLAVHPALPVKSVKELIALAKAKPGELNYASGTTGSSPHLAGELFKSMAGVNIVRIPYKSAGPAMNDLIGGQVQMMFATVASSTPHITGGRVRALAVTSRQPSALFPGVPTITASGLPGYESGSIQGVWAPAKTPVTIIARLNQEMTRVLNSAERKERALIIGAEAAPTSPQQFAEVIKSEMARLGKLIKDAGIKVE